MCNVACILTGGKVHKILVDGKTHYFELPPYCGLFYCNANGDPRRDPAMRNKFWNAVNWWQQQGSRIGDDGYCVWESADPLKGFVKIGPRTWVSESIANALKPREDGR